MKINLNILLYAGFVMAVLSGCYSQSKAKGQFGKAVTAYPVIGADFCALTYPPKDRLIKGDTVHTTDTFYTEGSTQYDTIRVKDSDTIRIIKTIQLPGTKTIEKYFIHDTLQVVNTAELKACQLSLADGLRIANDYKSKYEIADKKAHTRFWMIIGLAALVAAYVGFKIWGKSKSV